MAKPRKRNAPAGRNAAIITELKAKTADPNLRIVRVGRKTVATLRAAEAESLGLQVGLAWTDAIARRVAEHEALAAARKIAIGLLNKRGYSRTELTDRLIKRGCEREHAAAVAGQMQADGWLNEKAYADDIVQATLRKGPAGRMMLEERLARRSIGRDVARQTIAGALNNQDDRAAALQLAAKRFRLMQSLPAKTAARRLAGLLGRRGFDEGVIGDTLEALGLGPSQDRS